VGDVDASGAYMVSSQADAIVANPGSAVGSIGVITEIPNVAGLLDKLGVQFKVITAGKYKDAGSPYRSLTSTETALIQGDVDQVYGQFIDIVASGRHLPRSQVESMATGWAWNAVQAKQLGLVDQIGTYKDALDKAAKLGHIQGAYQTDVYDESQFSSIVSSLLGIETQLSRLNASNPTDPASLGGSTLAK
jgi:protease-4